MPALSRLLPPPRLLKREEAAAELRIHERTLRAWIRRGYLPAIKLPSGAIRIERQALEALIAFTSDSEAREDDPELRKAAEQGGGNGSG